MKHFLLFILVIFIFAGCKKNQEVVHSSVPQWAKKAVWYQIFPERFNNGDIGNDPKPEDMAGGWPYFTLENWKVTSWTSDWYELQPWEKVIGKDFYWIQGTRRYGGDLQGVLDKLDYLQELGITAIYFNPLFESPSLHKYDAAMYHHIDDNFGPDPVKDKQIWAKENPADPSTWQWTTADKLFLKLIDEVHKRDMKIIIDGVFNHVGANFWAFKDVVKNQQNSKYKDWFYIKSWDDPDTEKNEFEYEGWYGVQDLPEIKEDEKGLIQEPKEHIHAIVKRWMDPNNDGDPSDGIDGWRLDVAEMVEVDFWKDFRIWVKGINPEAYITGEIWWDDWNNNKIFNAAPWLQGDMFDAVMNYRFAQTMKNYIIDDKNKINTQEFVDSISKIYSDYPEENNYVLQNLFNSHDVERLSSQIVNPDLLYDHGGHPGQTKTFNVESLNENEKNIQKLMVGMQMTMLGAPMIYYGDEAGMWGGDDPDCRKPMIWPELKYDDEIVHPFNLLRKVNKVEFDQDLFEWYKKMISIRKNSESLMLGDVKYFIIDNENSILGYSRTYKLETTYIIVNNSEKEVTKVIEIENKENEFVDLIVNTKIKVNNEKIKIQLQPYQIIVLK